MRHVTLKNVFARKLRLLTTSIAIAFGVAFVTGALILGATINKTFDDLFANAFKNTDSVVRGEKALSIGGHDVRLPIESTLLAQVKAVPGVVDAKVNYDATVQLVGPDAKTVNSGGAPTFADSWGIKRFVEPVPNRGRFSANNSRSGRDRQRNVQKRLTSTWATL